jgi:hypothetical protein
VFGTGAYAQQKDVLSGVLLTKEDSTPIVRAHIINLSAKRGTISDVQGNFSISPQPTDSISISVIGYKTLVMEAQYLPEIIYLVERNYQLELFNVMPYKTFEEFREAFVNLDLPDTTRHVNPTIYLSKEELVGMGRSTTGGIIIPGVISSIFASFNKLMQDKITYEELLQRDEYEAFLATKFNGDLVQRITQLKDNSEINDFIKYCDFSNHYIEHNSNYTIITQVFECYDEYISLSDLTK